MNTEDLAQLGSDCFVKLGVRAELRTQELPDGLGVCVFHPVRGGGKIFVAPDETVLFVGSALDFASGLAAFRQGWRTPFEKFRRVRASGAAEGAR